MAPAYSSPIIAELGGTRQVITQSQNRLVGVAAADGRAAVGGAAPHQLRPELSDTSRGERARRLVRPREPDNRLPHQPGRVRLAGTGSLAQRTGLHVHELAGDERPGALRTLPSQPRAVRRAGRSTGKTLWATRGREADNASFIRTGEWLLIATTNSELIVARASAARFDESDALHHRRLGDLGPPGGHGPDDRRKGRRPSHRMESWELIPQLSRVADPSARRVDANRQYMDGSLLRRRARAHCGATDGATGSERGDGRAAGGVGRGVGQLARLAGPVGRRGQRTRSTSP